MTRTGGNDDSETSSFQRKTAHNLFYLVAIAVAYNVTDPFWMLDPLKFELDLDLALRVFAQYKLDPR